MMEKSTGVPASPPGHSDEPASGLAANAGSVPNAVEERISKLLALEEGWNGYRAPRISAHAVDRARPFIAKLEEWRLAPWLTPLSDGGVSIERAGADDYSIDFAPDGSVSLNFDITYHSPNGVDTAAAAILATAQQYLPRWPSQVAENPDIPYRLASCGCRGTGEGCSVKGSDDES